LLRQRGAAMGLNANLSQVFDDSGQWMEIKPRIADSTVEIPVESLETAVGKTAGAAKNKITGLAKTAAANSKTKAVAKNEEMPVKWCVFKSGDMAQRKAIINEVAWMGTIENYSNEWIELKNYSGKNLDIGDWQLQNKSQKIKISFDEGETLPAAGLYLLERTDDESVAGITADKIYSGSLGNLNEALYLFDANCKLQDSVVAIAKWPGGDNVTKQTMARMPDLSWRTSNISGGTPKAEN
jgi:hypothetical protein